MMLCKDLFGDYLDPQLNSEFGKASVVKCDLNIDDRTLALGIESDTYINSESIFKFRNRVKEILKLSELEFSYSFDKNAFCVTAVEDAVKEICVKNAFLIGYFNEAEYEISEA